MFKTQGWMVEGGGRETNPLTQSLFVSLSQFSTLLGVVSFFLLRHFKISPFFKPLLPQITFSNLLLTRSHHPPIQSPAAFGQALLELPPSSADGEQQPSPILPLPSSSGPCSGPSLTPPPSAAAAAASDVLVLSASRNRTG